MLNTTSATRGVAVVSSARKPESHSELSNMSRRVLVGVKRVIDYAVKIRVKPEVGR